MSEDTAAEPRFADKDGAREHVWTQLSVHRAAAFPFPIRGRIPNFVGARQAAERLMRHPAIAGARRVKANPDTPQRPFREAALRQGIELILPAPKLAGGFRRLDPGRIPSDQIRRAVTIGGAERWGEPIAIADLPAVDAVVNGSVAVTRRGHRCGKGHGYGDIEYAILRALGHPPAPVLTSVHPLQIVDDFPGDPHDLPVSVIATPDETIAIEDPPPAPSGIDWGALSEADLDAMPVLRELAASTSGECPG